MLGAINPAHTSVRFPGPPNLLREIREPNRSTPRVELPPSSQTNTNVMPHAHRETLLASALASQGPVFARALLEDEKRREPQGTTIIIGR